MNPSAFSVKLFFAGSPCATCSFELFSTRRRALYATFSQRQPLLKNSLSRASFVAWQFNLTTEEARIIRMRFVASSLKFPSSGDFDKTVCADPRECHFMAPEQAGGNPAQAPLCQHGS